MSRPQGTIESATSTGPGQQKHTYSCILPSKNVSQDCQTFGFLKRNWTFRFLCEIFQIVNVDDRSKIFKVYAIGTNSSMFVG